MAWGASNRRGLGQPPAQVPRDDEEERAARRRPAASPRSPRSASGRATTHNPAPSPPAIATTLIGVGARVPGHLLGGHDRRRGAAGRCRPGRPSVWVTVEPRERRRHRAERAQHRRQDRRRRSSIRRRPLRSARNTRPMAKMIPQRTTAPATPWAVSDDAELVGGEGHGLGEQRVHVAVDDRRRRQRGRARVAARASRRSGGAHHARSPPGRRAGGRFSDGRTGRANSHANHGMASWYVGRLDDVVAARRATVRR